MEELKDFLAIIGLSKFLKNSYEFLKDKNNIQKVKYYYYHRNSPKVFLAFLTGTGFLLLFENFLIYNLILLKFELSMQGMYIGMGVFLIFTIIPMLYFKKIYKDHKQDVQQYAI